LFERTVRGSYSETGVISHADGRDVTDDPGDIALGIVFGRAVLNVRLILSVGAGLPGTNAAEVGASAQPVEHARPGRQDPLCDRLSRLRGPGSRRMFRTTVSPTCDRRCPCPVSLFVDGRQLGEIVWFANDYAITQ
jgi:hypothetical protein